MAAAVSVGVCFVQELGKNKAGDSGSWSNNPDAGQKTVLMPCEAQPVPYRATATTGWADGDSGQMTKENGLACEVCSRGLFSFEFPTFK